VFHKQDIFSLILE